MSELSLIILKPDTVSRWITWQITDRFEKKWLKLVATKMKTLNSWLLADHYSHLSDKPFFPEILSYMTSAPVVLQIWEWKNVVELVRKLVGATNPLDANPW
jgi:nucleoside-diphosphate kinase